MTPGPVNVAVNKSRKFFRDTEMPCVRFSSTSTAISVVYGAEQLIAVGVRGAAVGAGAAGW